MRLWTSNLSLAGLSILALAIVGCNNTLNPLCSSARPVPVIQSLSPSSMTFADVQQGALLSVNGSQFVSSTEAVINSTILNATVVSPQKLSVKLSTDLISGPGPVNVLVETPSGSSGDLGCSSGGKSSALILTVN
jgi:hypothetical protein